ncbi:MAG: isocitrate/isopropylmalate dehydrogenase family protein [Armatimonadetes bacterium]|nr:isocitrate/isopropylmalate dehydrogenase family protein [Armatimonadota bacterium]NIM24602.1 isocitrate/isopropylmalate dehydrogenase family protein [Armatimonadota bacterium]NIM68478.1 isocitrate/isopropylmalate dehydrogenase family protein [Armatimonadota bacterium]NIM76864.1 isocitrate/isopropylmalate dehydrogenase family protein [Armatimonadota bacterium]NIN06675.1 isocitrate/isopropylmalate dehydrogenase family protein [Armatimonadota bacterium]
MAHRVTLIPGDGIGPEIVEASLPVIEAAGATIEWEFCKAGLEVMEEYGTPLPEEVLASLRRNRVGLKGPLTTPIGKGIRSVNVALRKALGLYACLRLCKSYPGVRSRYEGVDIIVVRENTEDLYAGVEFEAGSEQARQIAAMGGDKIHPESAISIKPISAAGTRRIVKFAFDYALANNRKKVTAITKANIMKFTDGLFFQVAAEVAKEYEGKVEYQEALIDAFCMQVVQRPENFDVLVLPNLYGDIVSDLCAGIVGGLGVAPGANIGEGCALFEPVHGSAPKYTGLNRTNPAAFIFSAVMMLRYLKETEAADRLEQAVAAVIAEGKSVTYDFKPTRDDPTAVGTKEMAAAILAKLQKE